MGVPVIATLLLTGLAFRLIIAYVLFPGSGFESDLGSFVAWSLNMAENGPGRFYETAGFADYPPAYLYVLWLVGTLARGLESLLGVAAADAARVLIKIPPMLADLGIGYLLYRMARRWFRHRPDAESLAIGAAAIYLVNPVAWYDSALWGQVDAVGALVMLVALALLVAGHSEGATAATVVAGLVKPQFGLVLLPLLAVVLLRRHLVRPGTGPTPEGVPERLRGWLLEEQGPWRLVSSAAVGMVTLLVLIAPFGLDLFDLVQRMAETAGGYPYLSVNAYDPWALVGADGRESLAAGGGWSPDEAPLLGPIPGVVIGTLLLAGGFLYGLVGAARREGRGTLLLALIFLSLAFFVLPTRVHERYLFPVFAFLPLLAAVDRRWWIVTVVLSVASFINFHGVLTTPLYATPNLDDFFLGPTFRSYLFVLLSVIGHVGVMAFVVWRWRRGDARLVEPLASGLDREAPPEPAGEVVRPTGTKDDRAPRAAEPPAWRSSLTGLWQRIDLAPLRADRSARLRTEPRGGLDRLDLLVVVLVFVAALTSRTWRLEEPYEMHFDEVYHARTATEFLQDWRYRLPHDIYEYTHPHLAKYLIAAGLVLAGNDRVTAGSDLGVPLVDAVLETRWSPEEQPAQRDGDRLYVATGSELRVYDLARRGLIVSLPVAAERLVIDEVEHRLFAVAAGGSLVSISTTALDLLPRAPTNAPPATSPPSAQSLAQLPGPVRDLAVDADGTALVALLEDGRLLSLDPVTGETFGEARIDDAAALVAVDSQEAVMVDPNSVEDVEAVSGRLAELLGQDAGTIQRRIEAASDPVPLLTYPTTEQHDSVQEALDAGELAGVSIGLRPSVAVSGPDRISVRDSRDLSELADVALPAPAAGMALVREGDRPTLYVAAGRQLVRVSVPGNDRPSSLGTVPMPGEISEVAWDPSSKLIHALGRVPDGEGSTIYVVEANANAVFADARLPFEPAALVLDTQPERPSADRQEALALSPDGRVAAVDIGSHAFAWRLPGVIAGAFTAAFLYLLGRLLFRRRLIGGLVALMALVDGMFFANARIAMNDTYVIAFIVASTTLFAALWLGHLRSRAALIVGLPLLGILLGLALASKWVGAYAIGGLLVLFLLRSALGRLLLLAGMVTVTAVLGVLAISASPEVTQPRQNFLFLALLVVVTVALAAGITLRPARLSQEQLRVALGSLLAGGALLVAVGALARHRLPTEGLASGRNVLLAGGLLVLLAAGGYGVALLAGRQGIGPLVPGTRSGPSERGPRWLDPGWRAGLPWLGALLCLTALPLVVYVLHYVPWAQPWHLDGPRLASDWPIIGTWPPGHTGQAFADLQRSMYDYHNNLRATHAASSPWWAWPLDLKPVWFYSEGLANDTSAYIYDSGNLVLFWLAIPAAVWTAWMAWRRRSLPLTLVVVMMLSLWLPWARIDRATFQYHVFTSLPFAFLALAYLLAELWQGPSRRTWLLARVSGALALVGAPLLWLGRGALCGLAGTEIVREGSQACGGAISTPVGVHQADLYALLALGLCALLAWFVLTARDSRRFVAVALGLAVLWFVAWYPNLAALPMPHIQANVFQVFLPTYNYDFQFAVNTDPPFPAPLLGPDTFALLVGVALLTAAVIYAAAAWREALQEEPRGSPPEPGA
jgi:hypothetical protein